MRAEGVRQFQFTHPRGVRQYYAGVAEEVRDVSIHAPTRGATPQEEGLQHLLPVSIHAPTRGATSTATDQARARASFNSRTHEGCDPTTSPAWTGRSSFNSRTHEGCDLTARDAVTLFTVSIHAPTRGATRMPGTTPASMPSFNSRTHEGCDVNRNRPSKGKGKFQFTHPRGVRHRHMRRAGGEVPVSIHAPTRGATAMSTILIPMSKVSIHAPTRGAT